MKRLLLSLILLISINSNAYAKQIKTSTIKQPIIIKKSIPNNWKISVKKPEIKYSNDANLSLNPAFISKELAPGEFNRIIVCIFSDKATKIFLKKRFKNSNIHLSIKELSIIEEGWVELFLVLPKSGKGYKNYIDFYNENGDLKNSISINIKNKFSIKQSTSFRMQEKGRSHITHSFGCSKGTWGWRASGSIDHNENEDRISGSFTINW